MGGWKKVMGGEEKVGGWKKEVGGDLEAVVVAASKAVEVLLDLLWRASSSSSSSSSLSEAQAQEISHKTTLLLQIASCKPSLLLKRAVTVASGTPPTHPPTHPCTQRVQHLFLLTHPPTHP